MNNSDHNDFQNWQNGDENEMNNPNNHMGGFFYFGDPKFREILFPLDYAGFDP